MAPSRVLETEVVGTYKGYTLVRHRGDFFGVPHLAGPVDFDREDDWQHAGVIRRQSREQILEHLDGSSPTEEVPVEFAGWLPIFEFSGNCGRHPQFKHTDKPPDGYRFTCSAPLRKIRPSFWTERAAPLLQHAGRVVRGLFSLIRPIYGVLRGAPGVSLCDRIRVLVAICRMFRTLRRNGAALLPTLRFLQSRHLQSQLLIARHRGLVFLPSMPYTYGQNPWVVEIEDPTTLFYPLIQNGGTDEESLSESPYFPIIRTLLESDECKGILTHMHSTAKMVATLFRSDKIREKVIHTPIGVRLPDRWQRHQESETINLLFTNSWHQLPGNFYLRGGLDVLEAFSILHERYPHLRLTLRTHMPLLDVRYQRILEKGWVRVINRFMSSREMESLLADSHIYLLPAARVHIVSLLQAMAHGLAVVASDGWGFDEYVTHRRNGLIVKGRYGKVSWADYEAGMLREDYEPMYKADPRVVRGIVRAVSRLVENRALRKRLGRTARRDVETNYTLDRWNAGLKQVFDKARLVSALPRGEREEIRSES